MVMTEVLLIVALHHTSSHFITLHHASSRFITLHHASALRTQIGEKMIKKVKRTENGVPKWGQSHKTIQDDARCQFSGALRSALRLHEDSLKTPWDSLETPDLTIQCVMLMPVQWRKWHQGVTRDELVSTFHGFTWFHWGFTEVSLLAKSLSVASIVGEHWTYWTNNYKDCNLNAVQHFALTSMLVSYCQMLNGTFVGFIKLGECSPIQKRCFDSNPRNPRNNDCCLCSNTGATHPFSAANASERKSCPTASIAASRGMAPDCGFATRISKVRELWLEPTQHHRTIDPHRLQTLQYQKHSGKFWHSHQSFCMCKSHFFLLHRSLRPMDAYGLWSMWIYVNLCDLWPQLVRM